MADGEEIENDNMAIDTNPTDQERQTQSANEDTTGTEEAQAPTPSELQRLLPKEDSKPWKSICKKC